VKVAIDDDFCRGHGICCGLCPEVFELTPDGYAEVRTPVVPPELEEDARLAADRCPEGAITVT
jgi:ferredoxin